MILALMIAACSRTDRAPAPDTAVAPSATSDTVADADAEVARLRSLLATAEAHAAAEHARAEAAEDERERAVLAWVARICALAAIGCAIAAFFIPSGKRLFFALAGALAAGAALAKIWSALAWLLPWVGAALLLIGLGVLVWHLRRSQIAAQMAARFGDVLEQGWSQDEARRYAARSQDQARVRRLVGDLRARDKVALAARHQHTRAHAARLDAHEEAGL
jgi:hypothetical protein